MSLTCEFSNRTMSVVRTKCGHKLTEQNNGSMFLHHDTMRSLGVSTMLHGNGCRCE